MPYRLCRVAGQNGVQFTEAKRLKQLEHENAKLKNHLVYFKEDRFNGDGSDGRRNTIDAKHSPRTLTHHNT